MKKGAFLETIIQDAVGPTQEWVRREDIRVLDILPVVPGWAKADSCKQVFRIREP